MDDRRDLANRVVQLSPAKLAALREHLKSRSAGRECQRAVPRRALEQARLSFAQQRIWFVDAVMGGAGTFNQAMKVTLSGSLNRQALQEALEAIVARHAILRSHIVVRDDVPWQIVTPSSQVKLSAAENTELAKDLDDWVVRIARAPFDLANGPPMRARLMQVDASTHVLVLVFHHIAFDAESVMLFAHELQELYRGRLRNEPSSLPPLEQQYLEIAQRERAQADSGGMDRHIRYWREKLRDLPVLNMPTDRPRRERVGHHSASITTVLPQGSWTDIEMAARLQGVTPFILLLTAYAVLISRYCRQEDIVIGSSTANRSDLATESLIGPFINTLVLRVELPGSLRVAEAISRVREVVLGALEHRDLPFDRLVAELNAPRSLRSHPLFQHAFVLSDASVSDVQLEGLKLTTEMIDAGNTEYELFFLASREQQALRLTSQFSTDLFDSSTVERLQSALAVAIRSLCSDTDRRIRDLPLLSAEDRIQVCVHFNQTDALFPEGATIQEVFEQHCKVRPDAVAIESDAEAVTFAELNRRADRLADAMMRRGVGHEALVCVLLERSVDFIVAVLASLKAGAAFVPIDIDYPLARLHTILDDCHAAMLVTRRAHAARLKAEGRSLLCVEELSEQGGGHAQDPSRAGVSSENRAYIIYTSGSTGRPKGVEIEHRSVVNLVRWQAQFFGIVPGARISQFASVGFDGIVGEMMMALLNGGTLVLLPREPLVPSAIVRSLRDKRIDVAVFVPSLLRLMEPEALGAACSTTVVSVGEPCRADLARHWMSHVRFVNGYGPTECTVYSHAHVVRDDEVEDHARVPVGLPMSNIRSYVLDAQLEPVPRGGVGELYLSGVGLARGYHGRPALSAQRFVPNPFAIVGSRVAIELRPPSASQAIEQFRSRHVGAKVRRADFTTGSSDVIGAALNAVADVDLRHCAENILSAVEASGAAAGVSRYLTEAESGEYCSCGITVEVLQHLLGLSSITGLSGADFGCGRGEVLELLSSLGADVVGLDYVPRFVEDARSRGLRAELVQIDAESEAFHSTSGIGAETLDFALATLVLDRVADPLQLLRNMLASLRPRGRIALQTLLPVIPLDDSPEARPQIHYTRTEHRIVRGLDASEDRDHLTRILERGGIRDIRIYKFPYAVLSLDGLQVYECWSFVGAKCARDSQVDTSTRLYRTGDLARLRADGAVEVLGRVDQQIKVRGFRVEIEEIEAVLLESSSVVDAAIVALTEDPGTRLVACVVPREPCAPDDTKHLVRELRLYIAQRLPHFMVPAEIIVLNELPLSPSGKVDKQALTRLPLNVLEVAQQGSMPSEDDEFIRTIADCWAKALNREAVGRDENLFDLGADSILIVQIVAQLRRRGIEASVEQLFQQQTVAELAAALRNRASATLTPRAQDSPACEKAARGPLTPIQAWFLERVSDDVAHDNQAIVLELREAVEPEVMRAAVGWLVRRHAMLRMRLTRNGAEWHQAWDVDPAADVFEYLDWGTSATSQMWNSLSARVQAALDPRTGAVARFVLVAEQNKKRLLCAVHHLAVDLVSWHLLIEDLSSVLESAHHGNAIEAAVAEDTAYRDWAVHLEKVGCAGSCADTLAFWNAERSRLPSELVGDRVLEKERDAETLSERLTRQQTAELESLAAACNAQLQDVVLAALTVASGTDEAQPAVFLDYEAHGRFGADSPMDLSRTVGWFTAIFPMLLQAQRTADGSSVISEIARQRSIYQRHGRTYGVLRYNATTEQQLHRWPDAPISFNHLGRVDATLDGKGVFTRIERAPGSARASHKARFYPMELISFIQDHCLHIELRQGPANRESARQRFAGMRSVLQQLLNMQAQRKVTSPITPIQHGMLFHCLSAPDSGVYVNQVCCRIEGSLQLRILQDAWLEVSRRHSALHTGFLYEGVDEPVQFLASIPRLECTLQDWSDRPATEQETLHNAWLAEDRRRGFKLDAPPLMRLCFTRRAAESHVMVWTFHHLVVDGWSVALVLKEVLDRYEARCGGHAVPTAPAESFVEQVAWALRKCSEDHSAFWRQHLQGASVMAPLPIDGGRHAETHQPGGLPGEQIEAFTVQETADLLAFCRRNRLTLNTLVLAAWGLTLSCYAASRQVLFGVTLSGRTPELENINSAVGMFINTVPLSLDVAPHATVLDWLNEVQRRQVALQSVQHSPLGSVLLWTDLSRREQPFDSVVLFENYPIDASLSHFEGTISIRDPKVIQQSNYPLTLVVLPTGALRLCMGYATARFGASDIARMLEHMRNALLCLAGNPQSRLRELSLLTAPERHMWQRLGTAPQERSSGDCIQDLFDARARLCPDAVAVRCDGDSLTYAYLSRQSNQLANYLISLGAGPERVVAICLPRSLPMYVGLLGILKAGAAYLPLDLRLPLTQLQAVVKRAHVSVMLSVQETAPRLSELGASVLVLDSSEVPWSSCSALTPAHRAHEDCLAYVMFTSGSTGAPKGILGSHRATLNCLRWMWDAYPFSAGEVCCQKTALAFGDSIQEIFGPLLAGIPTVIVPDATLLDPRELLELLADHEVTRIVLVPSLLSSILKAVPDLRRRVPKLTHWLASGESLSADVANLFVTQMSGCVLINMYGASELANDVTIFEARELLESVPIGVPVAGMSVRLLDQELAPIPTAVSADLYVGGPGLARGYLGQPGLTAQAFVPDPFADIPGSRLYRTGDLAFVDAQGQLHFSGRRDQQIKVRGMRVDLNEITAALESYPGVEQAHAIAADMSPGEKQVLSAVTPTRLQRHLSDQRCLTLPNGMPMLQHHQSETEHIYHEIFVDRIYALHGIEIEPGDILFDVGANIGLFTLFAHYELGARVFAFEPAASSFELLSRNIELHGCRASAFNVGIAETQDVRAFTHYPRSSLLSGFHADFERDARVLRAAATAALSAESERDKALLSHMDELVSGRLASARSLVPVISISQALRNAGIERIDLLKIDVERSELEVLKGITADDWPRIRQIVVEVEDERGQLGFVVSLLNAQGYVVTQEISSRRFSGAQLITVYAARPHEPSGARSASAWQRPEFPAKQDVTPARLREHLRERLPEYMLPAWIEILDEFPRTTSGKVDRSALVQRLCESRRTSVPKISPLETEMQRTVAAVWQETLGLRAVGRDDSFFDIGGHSLLMIGICTEIARRTNRAVSILDLYRYPTVGALAGFLSEEPGTPVDMNATDRGRQRASLQKARRRARQEAVR